MYWRESLAKRCKERKGQNYICHHMWIIRSMRYICIYMFVLCIKCLWEDSQEIYSGGCLCEGVLESVEVRTRRRFRFHCRSAWTSLRVPSGFTLPRHSSTAKEWRAGDKWCLTSIIFWGFWWPFLLCLCLALGPYFWYAPLRLHPLFRSASVAGHRLLVLEILSLLHSSPQAKLGLAYWGLSLVVLGLQASASCRPLWGHPRQCLFLDLPLPQPIVSLECKIRREFLLLNHLVT